MGNRFDDLFNEANEAFNREYSSELKELKALSEEQKNSITPNTKDAEAYAALIEVVEQASRENLSQAQLANNIRDLGSTAVKLAAKVSSLAAIVL